MVSAVMSSIKSIRELELVQSKSLRKSESSFLLHMHMGVSVVCVCVFVYPSIVCTSMETGLTNLVCDPLLVYL